MNKNITTLSLGMIELINTLTNPPYYQILANSLNILTTHVLDGNRFLKKLFTVFVYDKIFRNEDMVKSLIFEHLSYEIADYLYLGNENYSFGT